MKRQVTLLFIFLMFIVPVVNASPITGDFLIDSKATAGPLDMSIFIKCTELNVASVGNVFDFTTCSDTVDNITGVGNGWLANLTVLGSSYPTEWSQSAPTTDEINDSLWHFELTVNDSTAGSYAIFFKLSQANLGSIPAANISLFYYNTTDWTNLSTTLINGVSDPALFFANITSFSVTDFIIGEKAPVVTTVPPTTPKDIGGRTTGSGGGIGAPYVPLVEEEEEKISPFIAPVKVIKDIIDKVVEKMREPRVYYWMHFALIAGIILVSIGMIIINAYREKHKKHRKH